MREPYYADPSVSLYCGDVREVLREMPAASVQTVVTSPPYWGLRDYGLPASVWGGDLEHEHEWGRMLRGRRADLLPADETNSTGRLGVSEGRGGTGLDGGRACTCGAWLGQLGLEPDPGLYVEHLVEVFREVRRVLRKDGTLWLNMGDSFAAKPRGNDRGWDKSRLTNPGRQQKASGASLRSTGERHRGENWGLKNKDLVGSPWATAVALRGDGWWLRQEIIWAKPNHLPESVDDRPTTSHERVFLLARSERYRYDGAAIREPLTGNAHGRIPKAAERAFSAKRSTVPDVRQEAYRVNGVGPKALDAPEGVRANGSFAAAVAARPEYRSGNLERKQRADAGGPQGDPRHQAYGVPWEDDGQGRNARSVWWIPTSPYPGAHFATFPPRLVRPCVLAGAPEGGVVLDPFIGSGTTAMVAKALGRRAIGIDLSEEYLAMARSRVEAQTPGMRMESGE